MIVFARPRHEYESYADFWTLVQVSGYPLIFIDEIDPLRADCVYIYSTPDASHEWAGAKAKIIYWLIEWYGDYVQKPGIAETWVSNATFAQRLGARFVPLGSHEMLGSMQQLESIYDVAHMSYADIYRRRLLLDQLIAAGGKVAPNGWGQARDSILRSSKVMLHIHQFAEYPALAPLRAAIAAAYGLPLITENGWSTAPYTEAIYAPYDELALVIPKVIHYGDLSYYRQWIHQLMCHEYRFDKIVEAHV